MRSLKTTQRGFTIVELMVATALTGTLIIIIMVFVTNTIAQVTIDSTRDDLLREAQSSLDNLTQDVRLSSNSYEESSLPDDNTPDGNPWQSSDSTLVLATAALDGDDNIIFSDELHYTSTKNNVIYFVENGTLYKRTLAADVTNNSSETSCPVALSSDTCPPDITLARNVAEFSIQYYDGNGDEVGPSDARSVGVTLSLGVTKYGQDLLATYTTRTVFRNQ